MFYREAKNELEVNCGDRLTRYLSSVYYDVEGNLFTEIGESDWSTVTPDTFGEMYLEYACSLRTKQYSHDNPRQ